jgi:hypothetical protein
MHAEKLNLLVTWYIILRLSQKHEIYWTAHILVYCTDIPTGQLRFVTSTTEHKYIRAKVTNVINVGSFENSARSTWQGSTSNNTIPSTVR